MLLNDFISTVSSLCKESPEVRKYLRESEISYLCRIAYLIKHYSRQPECKAIGFTSRDTAIKLLHANLSHYGRDRTVHRFDRFDWPGFQLEN